MYSKKEDKGSLPAVIPCVLSKLAISIDRISTDII